MNITKVVGDPHFYGAHGERFDFEGKGGESYCLVADTAVHINMHLFKGPRQPNATYIDEIGVLHAGHKITISAASAEDAHFHDVQGQVTVDGQELPEVVMTMTLHHITITRTLHAVRVQIPNQLDATMEIARAAYWADNGPGENFINFKLSYLKASKKVHGVLGQTYQEKASLQARLAASRRQRVAQREALLLIGIEEDYKTSSLLAADCTFARYHEVTPLSKA
eukprot:jgi/Mesen1/10963/ME000096S10538